MILGDAVRRRVLGAAIAMFALLAGGYTLNCLYVPVGWALALDDLRAHDGETVVLSLATVDRIDGPDRYVVHKSTRTVAVAGDTSTLAVGDDLSLGGVLRGDTLIEAWRDPAPLRDGKRALGITAVLLTLALLPVWFRVRDGWIVERG